MTMRFDDNPRIAPGTRAQVGLINFAIARLVGAAIGGGPPNVFMTLGRHQRLFRRWLRFAAALMPGGVLPRRESELVILRVAHNCACEYEWCHHERLGRQVGLTNEEIDRVRRGTREDGWSERWELLLRAADELHAERRISRDLWASLSEQFSEVELIELCMLVGHYEMLAMTVNALHVQPDTLRGSPSSRGLRALRSIATRRGDPKAQG